MDLFSKLPEKHIIRICYLFISLIYLVILFFAKVLFFAKERNAWTYFVLTGGMLCTLIIFAWILKGGMIQGEITPKSIKATMKDGKYGGDLPEDANVPVTQVMPLPNMPIKNKKAR